jgi:anti-sigma regulatory factor (Ser/Thr protein kinase)
VDADREHKGVRTRARDARGRSDRLRQQAASERERSQILAMRLMHTLRAGEGRPHGDHGNTFSLRLALMPQCVGLVRHELGRWLDEGGVASADVVDITLACSEACANAVEHPGRPGRRAFEVEARREEGELLLAVRDFGAWTPVARGGTRGRLGMIRTIMDAVEITSGGEGTQIMMRRTLRP